MQGKPQKEKDKSLETDKSHDAWMHINLPKLDANNMTNRTHKENKNLNKYELVSIQVNNGNTQT